MKLFLLVVLLFPLPAYAYLDSFTGSMIVQGIIAFIVTVIYVCKKKWRQLKAFLGFKSNDDSLEDTINDDK